MTDSKNIVIKLKYEASDTKAGAASSQPKMVTEWNVRRIVGALGVVALLIAAPIYFFGGDAEAPSTETDKNAATQTASPAPAQTMPSAQRQEPPAGTSLAHNHTPPVGADAGGAHTAHPVVAEPPLKSASPSSRTPKTGRVRRAALSYSIQNKEPAAPIGSSLSIINGKPVAVHYFTEVRGKTHQPLFHEWLKEGKLIYRHELNIAAERWRTSSQREFKSGDQGNWSARTVDEKGDILNQIQFSVTKK
ncbi:MAG: DUF2914 domain-containing protein [Gammaproteobacteria bacterium]